MDFSLCGKREPVANDVTPDFGPCMPYFCFGGRERTEEVEKRAEANNKNLPVRRKPVPIAY